MDEKLVVAHDLGTSSDKAVLVTLKGEILDSVHMEYPLAYPYSNWAEQNPLDFWNAVCETTRTVVEKNKIRKENVIAITLCSQMQCLISVDENGSPLRPSMSWLDSRSAQIIRETLWKPPRIMGYNIFRLFQFLHITGGSPGHTGKDQIGKILWLRKHEPQVFQNTWKFMDAKDFVNFKLTGNATTSVDVAYIWWLMDSRKKRYVWHPGLCKLAGITSDQLPEILESAAIVGHLTPEACQRTGLLPQTAVINGVGDLAGAAVGSGALKEGELHVNLGTSGWVAGHFSKRKIDLLHYTGCIGSAYPKKYYLGMAHQETAGICLEWLKNKVLYHKEQLKKEVHVDSLYQLFDRLAEKAGPGAEGLVFTPWMFGERCPIDNEFIRAGLYNIGLHHSREHLTRAVFEGIAFNTRWAMETLENLFQHVKKLHLVGGIGQSELWCQILADILNREVHRVSQPRQANARGAALLAGLALGFIPQFEDIAQYIQIDKVFYPNPQNRILYDRLFKQYKAIYKYTKNWYKGMNREKK